MQPLFALDKITYSYPGRPDSVLDGASFTVEAGQRVGLLGDNGSGKSTLLHIGAGLIRPAAGTVSHQGIVCRTEDDFIRARSHIGYLLQHAQDQLFCSTLLEDVAFGPGNQGLSPQDAARVARQHLEALDLAHLADRNGQRLSGGEQKLAALACILAMQPTLLFLDEPTNDLDPKTRERLIAALEHNALPAVIISHDREFLSRVCTRFLRLTHGQVTDTAL